MTSVIFMYKLSRKNIVFYLHEKSVKFIFNGVKHPTLFFLFVVSQSDSFLSKDMKLFRDKKRKAVTFIEDQVCKIDFLL